MGVRFLPLSVWEVTALLFVVVVVYLYEMNPERFTMASIVLFSVYLSLSVWFNVAASLSFITGNV